MKRKISEIMNDMDRLENFEISEKTQEKLREHFKHEIEREKLEKNKIEKESNEKVASGAQISGAKKDNNSHGESDRI